MSRSRGFARALTLLLAGAGALTGCHTYRVIDSPPIGSTVRVHVPVVSALNRGGGTQSVAVEGVLLSFGDSIALESTSRREIGAYRELSQVDTFRLATDQASLLEVRELSRKRSVVLGVAVLGGVTLAAIYGFRGGGSDPFDPGGPPPPVSSVVMDRSLLASVFGLIFR